MDRTKEILDEVELILGNSVLSDIEKLVWILIRGRECDEEGCTDTRIELATFLCRSKPIIITSIRNLKKLGFMKLKRTGGQTRLHTILPARRNILSSYRGKQDKENRVYSLYPETTEQKTIIDAWNNSGLREVKRKENETYKRTLKVLSDIIQGTFFTDIEQFTTQNKKFTVNEVLLAIKYMEKSLSESSLFPTKGHYLYKVFKETSLSEFFFNNYSHVTDPDYKSLFLYFLYNEPKSIYAPVDDKYPIITKTLKEYFKEEFRGGKELKLNPGAESRFIWAAKKTLDWFNNNTIKLGPQVQYRDTALSQQDIANLVGDTLMEQFAPNFNNIHPGHFCCNILFDEWLPNYLEKLGYYNPSEGEEPKNVWRPNWEPPKEKQPDFTGDEPDFWEDEDEE